MVGDVRVTRCRSFVWPVRPGRDMSSCSVGRFLGLPTTYGPTIRRRAINVHSSGQGVLNVRRGVVYPCGFIKLSQLLRVHKDVLVHGGGAV